MGPCRQAPLMISRRETTDKDALAGRVWLAQFGSVTARRRDSNVTLDGKRIVVLGGSSGIGLATAQAAAREGASVVIASSRNTRVDQALATLPASNEGQVVDLTDADAMQKLFARLGSFDHLA